MDYTLLYILLACGPLIVGWGLDLWLGDPVRLPHPVVLFGRVIAWCERRFNRGGGARRRLCGGIVALSLVAGVFVGTWVLVRLAFAAPSFLFPSRPLPLLAGCAGGLVVTSVLVFYCLAGTTLVREVRAVFIALDRSLDDGRRQVARIVGRDTSQLSAREVRKAALETLAENLSDGVIAPLFWCALLGVPGMMAYKMVNTLDSMIGYRTERYRDFGCVAARMDDVANWIPARLTALLMIISSGCRPAHFRFVARYGRCHASPNSGWPEAALAGALDCCFGGPHYYFGRLFPKPYIGRNDRPLTTSDMKKAVRVNRFSECLMMAIAISVRCLLAA